MISIVVIWFCINCADNNRVKLKIITLNYCQSIRKGGFCFSFEIDKPNSMTYRRIQLVKLDVSCTWEKKNNFTSSGTWRFCVWTVAGQRYDREHRAVSGVQDRQRFQIRSEHNRRSAHVPLSAPRVLHTLRHQQQSGIRAQDPGLLVPGRGNYSGKTFKFARNRNASVEVVGVTCRIAFGASRTTTSSA